MALDIIGNVVDKNNKEIKGVKVTDGVVTTTTNEDGYYEIKTEKTLLSFSLAGYPPKAIDLKSYKNPSAINLDVTLDGADIVANKENKQENKQDVKDNTKTKVEQKEDGVNWSKIILIGGGVVILGLLGFLLLNKKGKNK